MNKRKRVAVLKHRQHRKKLEEKRKSPVMATGIGVVYAEPVVETVQPEVPPAPKKKPGRKKKSEAVAIEPVAKVAESEISEEPPKKRGRKKKTETVADS